MQRMLPIALNHMAAPGLRYDAFLDLAAGIGAMGVEFRNDLPAPLFDGDSPQMVAAAAQQRGLRILALAEVKEFNAWTDTKRAEAEALADIARACGAEAVALIPRNDGLGRGNGERQANLRVALRELNGILAPRGLTGLVEPLGFESCSLRDKAEAVDVIEALGMANRFRLIHDTFHHHLAGGGPLFPAHTGIVHVSGVVDPEPSVSEMTDGDRVLVDARDRLGNVAQLAALVEAGYAGPVSMEPFSAEVHALDDPAPALRRSFGFIADALHAPAE